MTLRTTALVIAAGALIGAGAAIAQPAMQSGQQGYQHAMPRHHHGVKQIIRDEITAGRLSEKEGMLILQKVKEAHAERRAEREARANAENAPPPQQQR